MNFKIDENLPAEIADELRTRGYSAETVPEEGMSGAADSFLLNAALLENRILLTLDKGIADLRRYPSQSHAGVVLFRPDRAGRKFVAEFIFARLDALLMLDLSGRVTIVSQSQIRRR
jgi:predicted nuclease of predicted toxin-antitoxin system